MYCMKYVVGLGNAGEEYVGSRHNVGRDILAVFQKQNKFSDWKENKKTNSMESTGKIGKQDVVLVLPNTFMNLSGKVIAKYITNKKKVEDLLVLYDDIDLGLGVLKLSEKKGSGGHKGVESTIRAIKSKDFARLRIGIVPTTPTGKLKKPDAGEKVVSHVLGKFSPKEKDLLKKVFKKSISAIELFIEKGYTLASNEVNRK